MPIFHWQFLGKSLSKGEKKYFLGLPTCRSKMESWSGLEPLLTIMVAKLACVTSTLSRVINKTVWKNQSMQPRVGLTIFARSLKEISQARSPAWLSYARTPTLPSLWRKTIICRRLSVYWDVGELTGRWHHLGIERLLLLSLPKFGHFEQLRWRRSKTRCSTLQQACVSHQYLSHYFSR